MLGLIACGGPTPPTGSLSITIAGLPDGVAAAVSVTGPGGFAKTVTTSGDLARLTIGRYTISAVAVFDDHAIVPRVFDAQVSAPVVDVAADATETTTVTHAWRPASGRGWISTLGGDGKVLYGFDRNDLEVSGTPQPAVSISYAPQVWEGIAFDANGNVWVARWSNAASLARFAASDLDTSGALVPDVVIDSSDLAVLEGPLGLAFDAEGALWVSGYHSNTIVKYGPAQLAASGSPAPQVVLSGSGTVLAAPCGLAFDSGGALWVANLANGTVVKFAPAQLATSGAPVPEVSLSSTAGHLAGAYALAFDAQDNLWVSPLSSDSIVRFDADQLVASGAPVPSARVTDFGISRGLAFDHSGDLWVHRRAGAVETLVRIADPSSLTMASSAEFATIIGLDFPLSGGFISFFPPPPGLPIHTP
jgi:streptogramin lyase